MTKKVLLFHTSSHSQHYSWLLRVQMTEETLYSDYGDPAKKFFLNSLKSVSIFGSIIQLYMIATLNKFQPEAVIFFLDRREKNYFLPQSFPERNSSTQQSFCHSESFTSITKLAAHFLAF